MFSLFFFVACSPDPMTHTDLVKPSDGRVRLEITPPHTARLGEPIEIEVLATALEGKGNVAFDLTESTVRGRVHLDDWKVVGASGHHDPGVHWEDRGGRLIPAAGNVGAEKPLVYTVTLNDWVSFDTPGSYALQLHSTRGAGDALISNAAPIEIQARDTSADSERLASLVAKIDAGDDADGALAQIRWMGSKETIALAVERLSAGGGGPIRDGWMQVLATHPDGALVRTAIETLISAPEGAVRMEHLLARAAVAYNEAYSEPLPGKPQMKMARERATKHTEVLSGAQEKLLGALTQKTGEAKGVSIAAIANSLIRASPPPAWAEQGWKAVREGFEEMPFESRVFLVQHHWDKVADPSIAAGVAALIREDALSVEVRDLALTRLARLDKTAAEPVLKGLIDNPKRAVGAEGLFTLCTLDAIEAGAAAGLVDRLDEASDRAQQLALIATYSDASHADALWESYQSEPVAVSTELIAGYTAYFLRHGDARASRILQRFNADHPNLLLFTAHLVEDPSELVRRAVRGLDASDETVRFRSSETICEYATDAVVPELLKRMVRSEGTQQEALVTALVTARGFTLPDGLRGEIVQQLSDVRAEGVMRSTVGADVGGNVLAFRMENGELVMKLNYRDYAGLEAIEAKLAQFTPEAVFKPQWTGLTPDEGMAMTKPVFAAVPPSLYVLKRR